MNGLCYMDGLVSTGNKFPYTILKIIFAIRKEIILFFINILKRVVDKVLLFLKSILCQQGLFGYGAGLFFFKNKYVHLVMLYQSEVHGFLIFKS